MFSKNSLTSYVELINNNRDNKGVITPHSCMQKYMSSLPFGYCYDYPISVSLKVTSACNLRCKHCFYSGNHNNYLDTDDFSTEELFALVDFLADDLQILSLILTGGEPFVRNDFLDVVERVKKKYIPLIIQTNGILINENIVVKLSSLLNLKTDLFHISLEGADKETHDKIRGDGTFEKTVCAIKLLRKYKLPVQINLTLTSISAPTMTNIFDLCNELDVKKISINGFEICNEEHRYLALTSEEIIFYSYEIYKQKQKYPDIFMKLKTPNIFDFINIPEARQFLDKYIEDNNIKINSNKCLACHNHNKLTISANGNVFLCSKGEDGDAILGNLREKDFYEIWENRFNTPYFQKRDITTTKCKNCKYVALCGTGCMASAYKKYGDINCAPAECSYFEEYLRGQNG